MSTSMWRTFNRLTVRVMMLLVSGGVFAGCSSEGDSPESVARTVVSALKAKNYDAVKVLCVTPTDLRETIEAAAASGDRDALQPPAGADQMADARAVMVEQALRRDFDKLAAEKDWNTIQIENIRARIKRKKGIDECDLTIDLSDRTYLYMDDLILTPRGWRIADSSPMHMHPR